MEQNNNPNVVMKVKGPGTTLLKVSGILMIVLGAIALIVQLLATAGMTLISTSLAALGASSEVASEYAILQGLFDSIGSAYLVSTIAAVVTLITGILALVFARKLGKGTAVIVFAALAIILTLVSNVMVFGAFGKISDLAAQNTEFQTFSSSFSFGFSNILSILASAILPVLAIIGVLKNKKAV